MTPLAAQATATCNICYIEADLEKIRAWFARVRARDCFTAARRAAAEAAIEASQHLLDGFVERVFEAESAQAASRSIFRG